MKNRKGQVAMEFLMTYGWAILVVLVVIGALAFLGLINPDSFLPEERDNSCNDFSVTQYTEPFPNENITPTIEPENRTTNISLFECFTSNDSSIKNLIHNGEIIERCK